MESNSQESLDDVVINIHMLTANYFHIPHPMGRCDIVCSQLNFFSIMNRYTMKHVIGQLDIVGLIFNKNTNHPICPYDAHFPYNHMVRTIKLDSKIISRIRYFVIQFYLGTISKLTLKCYRIDLTGTRNFKQFQLLIINSISYFKYNRTAYTCTVQGDSSITE